MQCHQYHNVEVHDFTETRKNIVKYLENELVSKHHSHFPLQNISAAPMSNEGIIEYMSDL
jgi:hypothetical protein